MGVLNGARNMRNIEKHAEMFPANQPAETWKHPETFRNTTPPLGGGVDVSVFPSGCFSGAGLLIGIGLGSAGAVSLLDADGRLLDVRDLPCLDDGPRARPTVSASGFAAIVREWRPERAVVEFVSSRPTDSPVSAFSFGMARATVMATLEVLGVPAEFITAPAWKRRVGIGAGRGQKSTARAKATRRWPSHAASFARVRDDGRAKVLRRLADSADPSIAAEARRLLARAETQGDIHPCDTSTEMNSIKGNQHA